MSFKENLLDCLQSTAPRGRIKYPDTFCDCLDSTIPAVLEHFNLENLTILPS